MFPFINTPFGEIEVYSIAPIMGALVAVFLQMFLLYRRTKRIYTIFYAGIFGICSWLGSYASTAVRLLTQEDVNDLESFWKGLLNGNVKHYLGEVLVIALFAIPLVIVFHRILPDRKRDWKPYVLMVTDGLAMSILIMQIVARIACLARGCCFGIPYRGAFSVQFPKGLISYKVFPTQLFEIVLVLILFVCIVLLQRKGKPIFGITLMGYSIIIFITEFFMDKRGTHTFYDFSMIQFFACILFIIGVAHTFYLKKIQGRKR